jgi:hypothetical protein
MNGKLNLVSWKHPLTDVEREREEANSRKAVKMYRIKVLFSL